MVAKIITDSCPDIMQGEAKRLGVTAIPAYVRFGNNVHRDGIDIYNVKPLVTIRNGQASLARLTRTRDRAITKVHEYLKSTPYADDLATLYSINPLEEVQAMDEHAHHLFPNTVPPIARLGPTVGAYAGPNALAT